MADTDAEKYYFRIISTLNLDKQYGRFLAERIPRDLLRFEVRDVLKVLETTTTIKRRKISCSFGSDC